MPKSFKFFASYLDAASGLSEKDCKDFVYAIVQYGINGVEIPLKKSLQPLWLLAKPSLEKSRKLQSYGEKGGRPKKPPFEESEKPPFQILESPLSKNEKPDKDKEKGIGERSMDKEEKKPSKEKPKPDVFADFAGDDAELLDALQEFNRMRTKSGKPMTEHAKVLLCNKLKREFQPCEWVQVIEQSTLNNWQSVFPLKGNTAQQSKGQTISDNYDVAFADLFGGNT